MQKEALEDFYFIPFTGIGYITSGHPPYRLCFPLMVEALPIEEQIPEKYTLLEPQAKFEMSVGRKKWIETYYYMTFVFNKEHETVYDYWRKFRIPEKHLTFLREYDEVEVPICIITHIEKENGEKIYQLVHNFTKNHFAFVGYRNEKLFVLPKSYCEGDLLDLIDEVIRREIKAEFKKRKLFDISGTKFDWRKRYKSIKILYLNEELQNVYNEEKDKIKKVFKLN